MHVTTAPLGLINECKFISLLTVLRIGTGTASLAPAPDFILPCFDERAWEQDPH